MEPRHEYNLRKRGRIISYFATRVDGQALVGLVANRGLEVRKRHKKLKRVPVREDLVNRSEGEGPWGGGVAINDLPNECLLHVFSHINCVREKVRLERVCRRWQDLVIASIGCHHKNLTQPEHLFYEKELRSLRSRSHQVKTKAKRRLSITTTILVNVLRKCPKLRAINTSRITGSLGVDLSLAGFADEVKKLRMIKFGIKSMTLSSVFTLMYDKDLAAFLKKCPQLETFEVQECYGLRGNFLQSIGKDLKRLDISDCFGIDDACLIKFLNSKGSNLTSLILRMEFLDGEAKNVLSAVTSNCLKLEVFHWKDYDDDEIDFTSLSKLSQLKELDVKCDIECLGDDTFLKIAESCSDLRRLSVSYLAMDAIPAGITDAALTLLPKYCPHLASLHFSETHGITDNGMESLAKLKKLETLSFRDCSGFGNGVIELMKKMKERLKELSLHGCEKVDKLELEKAALVCPLVRVAVV